MRVFNISDNLPPHWTQRQFEMESLLLHRRPCSVKIVVCKCIAGFACLNEWHNICKPAQQMEHFLHPRAKRKSEEEKLTRWLGEPSVSRRSNQIWNFHLPLGISLREEKTSVACCSSKDTVSFSATYWSSPVDFQTSKSNFQFCIK